MPVSAPASPLDIPGQAGHQAAGGPWIMMETAEVILPLQESGTEDAGMACRLTKDSFLFFDK